MLRKGSIVRLNRKPGRRTRECDVTTAVMISDPYEFQGEPVCALGFFSPKWGAWVKTVSVSEILEADGTETLQTPPKGVPNSYLPEYRIWMNMRRRCSDPRNQGFYLYVNRATVCVEWEQSFEAFYRDVGSRPSPKHSLDRIDNNGNYEPGNVRWATPKQQARNTSKTRFLTAFGKTKALTEWAEELGIRPQSLKYRLKRGWDVETAVSRPMSKTEPWIASLESNRKRGTDSHLSKLNEDKVRDIRARHESGESMKQIADLYGVSPNTICFIVHRKTWKHVS